MDKQKILVSLYDSKAEVWTPPRPCDSKAAAIREFQMLVSDPQKTLVSSNPADFDLWQIGVYEDGCVASVPANIHLANGADFAKHE